MDDDARREQAIKRLKEKRAFKTHLVTYVVINAFLIGVWALSGGGAFWPGWVLLGWGIGLAFHGWNAYGGSRPITESEIRKELDDSD